MFSSKNNSLLQNCAKFKKSLIQKEKKVEVK